MLYSAVPPSEKRRQLRRRLTAGELTVLPGAFSAVSAQLIARRGAAGVYVSGHMIAADLGLPDLGLTTITEVAERGRQIARMVDVPVLIDADTGFGEPLNAARSIQSLEEAGVAGCHIEDQVNPKQCGHSEGIAVVDSNVAVRRVRAAVDARRDPDFVVIARTDARAVQGLDAVIDRARAFVDAGADVIFPEALRTPDEYAAFRRAIDVPLMINLNEFGRGTPLAQAEVRDLGYELAIYPVTLLRLAMNAALRGIDAILADGSQHELLPDMQTKDELYDLLGYDRYRAFDDAVFVAR
ncbi:methylisocitrate lyase [Microbacterium sp. NPDC055910]|uniref:methylisocitrate lyase n=1 Tax=Microbacterium sp. NPDC055910 TaxID=3345659 RepID=UPI0035DCBEA0